MIDQEVLHQSLNYDPETGVFIWKSTNAKHIKIGEKAGQLNGKYWRITLFGRGYGAHRLAWLYMTGEWPAHQIDHIDGNPQNNKWCNLRDATPKQNMENRKLQNNNSSGFRGVSFYKRLGKWQAKIKHNKKMIHVGLFDSPELAAKAVICKRAEMFTHDNGRGDSIKERLNG